MVLNWKLITLLGAVFLSGIFIRGEIARRADLKRDLKEIKDQQARTMARVDSINAEYAAQKLQLAQKTDSLYVQISEIVRLKSLNSQRINQLQRNIEGQREQLQLEIHDLQQTVRQHSVGIQPRKQQN